MSWLRTWRTISARIEGMTEAGKLMIGVLGINNHDSFNVIGRSLRPEMENIMRDLEQFAGRHMASLPVAAAEYLQKFLERKWIVSSHNAGADIQAIVPWAVFRSGFEYLVRDSEEEARTLTELAFEHLRRLLVVDVDVKSKWLQAFAERENQCEKLGAVHLLSHGIWAFKVSSVGAATDLVFGEPVENEASLVRRTARALVLTEWKLVRNASELEVRAAEARHQAQSYAAGVLGDLELRQARYIILVTKELECAIPDRREGEVTYRHILLPIQQRVPSKAARQHGKRSA